MGVFVQEVEKLYSLLYPAGSTNRNTMEIQFLTYNLAVGGICQSNYLTAW